MLFVSLLGCSGEITAEELCGRADEAGCFEGSGDSYDSCVAVNKPSEEEARRLGCVSEHQTLRACILGELDVGVCALYGISDMRCRDLGRAAVPRLRLSRPANRLEPARPSRPHGDGVSLPKEP